MTDEQKAQSAAENYADKYTSGIRNESWWMRKTDFKAGVAWRDKNPSEAVMALVEALLVYSKIPEWKNITSSMNMCMDECPADCDEHDFKYPTRARSVSHGTGIASEALTTFLKSCGCKTVDELKKVGQ